ncbi:MAG: hypothetical protein H8E15_02020 [Planctomycetes bacterium]|nr:hypothetical protein [Planctomycetota bacterium]
MKKLALIALGACLMLADEVRSQEILSLGIGGDLWSIDPGNGQASLIGWTGHHTHLWNGLAQGSQGRLFAATGDWIVGFSIYEIDPQTGAGTFVVQTNLTEIGCMAFAPDDTLFIGHDPNWPTGGGIYELYTLDLNNGTESLVGSTEIVNLLALDFFADQLYGHNTFEGLMTIDTTTGAATDVNQNFLGPGGGTMSICFNDQGALYYLDHALWVQDKGSGIRSPIDWTSVSGR